MRREQGVPLPPKVESLPKIAPLVAKESGGKKVAKLVLAGAAVTGVGTFITEAVRGASRIEKPLMPPSSVTRIASPESKTHFATQIPQVALSGEKVLLPRPELGSSEGKEKPPSQERLSLPEQEKRKNFLEALGEVRGKLADVARILTEDYAEHYLYIVELKKGTYKLREELAALEEEGKSGRRENESQEIYDVRISSLGARIDTLKRCLKSLEEILEYEGEYEGEEEWKKQRNKEIKERRDSIRRSLHEAWKINLEAEKLLD